MSVINLETYLYCQKLYGVAKLEDKMFSLEYASQNRQHLSKFIKVCKRMFSELPETVYCIPLIIDLKNNRHFIIDRGNISVSSLVCLFARFSSGYCYVLGVSISNLQAIQHSDWLIVLASYMIYCYIVYSPLCLETFSYFYSQLYILLYRLVCKNIFERISQKQYQINESLSFKFILFLLTLKGGGRDQLPSASMNEDSNQNEDVPKNEGDPDDPKNEDGPKN